MLTRLSIALVASTVAAFATAHAAAWQTHAYETDGFVVDFSGPVLVKPIDLDANTMNSMTRSTSYMQNGGDTYVYLVGASLLKETIVFDFDAGVKGTIDTYKCAQIDSDISARHGTGQSREIHGTKCKGDVRVGARFVKQGRWFYQVVYLITPKANADDAAHFLATFKVLDSSAVAASGSSGVAPSSAVKRTEHTSVALATPGSASATSLPVTDADGITCVNLGFTPGTTALADCRLRMMEMRQQEGAREATLKAQERRAREQKLLLGLCMMAGSCDPIRRGTAAVPSQPAHYTYRLPDGRVTTCVVNGSVVNCF